MGKLAQKEIRVKAGMRLETRRKKLFFKKAAKLWGIFCLLAVSGRLSESFNLRAESSGKDVGSKVMDVTLLNQEGKTKKLSTITQGKKSLIYFYSSCCGHCGEQLSKFTALTRTLTSHKIEMVGIQYLGNTQSCKVNAEKYKFPGNILLDSKGDICGRFGVGDFTILTLDSKGTIQFRGNADNFPAIKKSLQIPD